MGVRSSSMLKIIILFILSLVVSSCTVETGSSGYRSDDKEYTKHLYQQLDKFRVKYSVDEKGFINYTKDEKDGFLKAQEAVEHMLSEGANTKPKNPDDLQYLVKLLKAKNLEHYVLEREDGRWVKWYPNSDKHEQEIMLQVVEYNFAKQMKAKESCETPCT